VALNTINATPTIQCSDKACMVFILYSMALAEINKQLTPPWLIAPLNQLEIHEQLTPPWLNVPLKQHELHKQLNPPWLNVF
jgi:hypothetical protein